MNKIVKTFTWDEWVYKSLLTVKEHGEYMVVSEQITAKVLSVEKKEYIDGTPYIEVTFDAEE